MSELEHCIECAWATGNAGKGDGSLYIGNRGPYCEECFDTARDAVIADRQTTADTFNGLAMRDDLDLNQLRGKLLNLAAYYRNRGE